ncbi:MAG: hypothetical protein J1F65_05480 [Clostridiales bacterium]|nr:hypothetical protein [Clostridiales bacterium]
MDIEQGSIIFGLNSKKYPEQACFGVIITASCDIANQKVGEVYYLTAVNVKEWLCTKRGHALVIKNKRKALYNKLQQQVRSQRLNESLLVKLSLEEVKTVINETVTHDKTREDILNNIHNYLELINDSTIEKRKGDAQLYSHDCGELLNQISKGDYHRFIYLPEIAYMESSKKDNGIIVDFQEINCLPMEEIRLLVNGEIDYMIQEDNLDNLQKLKEGFWLKNKDDFAFLYGKISSPWREHLMQHFSFYFTRIGLDGAETKDFQKISEGIK